MRHDKATKEAGIGAGADGKGLWTLPALLQHVASTADHELTWAEGYAGRTPGNQPAKGVWLWGHYSSNDPFWDRLYRLADSSEAMRRYEWENDDQDQVTSCDDCYKLIETTARDMCYRPDYVWGDGYITCGTCMRDNLASAMEDACDPGESLNLTAGDHSGWNLEARDTIMELRNLQNMQKGEGYRQDLEDDPGLKWNLEFFGQVYADDPETRQEWDYRTPCPTCNAELWESMRAAAEAGRSWNRDGLKHEIPAGNESCQRCEGKGYEGRIHVNFSSRAYDASEVPRPEQASLRYVYDSHERACQERIAQLKSMGKRVYHGGGGGELLFIAFQGAGSDECLGEAKNVSPSAEHLAARLLARGITEVSLELLREEGACEEQYELFHDWIEAEGHGRNSLDAGIPVTPGYVQTALNRGLMVSWLVT